MTELPRDIKIRTAARGMVFMRMRSLEARVPLRERSCPPEFFEEHFGVSFEFIEALFLSENSPNPDKEEIAGHAFHGLSEMSEIHVDALRSDQKLWEQGFLSLDRENYGYQAGR